MSMSKAGQDRVQIEIHNVSPTAAPVRKKNIQHLGHRNSKVCVCVCVSHNVLENEGGRPETRSTKPPALTLIAHCMC